VWEQRVPYEWLTLLRREAPLFWQPETDGRGFWVFTRYDDIVQMSKEWETYSSEKGGILAPDFMAPIEAQNGMFIAMDPPRHDRIKSLFQQGFTPKRIAEHEDAIRAITRNKLDALGDRVEFDLMANDKFTA